MVHMYLDFMVFVSHLCNYVASRPYVIGIAKGADLHVILHSCYFTFMLPCVVIDFFLNNQPDALIIQIYFFMKLYMFRASSVPTIRSFLLYIRHWQVSCRFFDDSCQAETGWNCSSILSLLGNGHQKPA